MARSREQVLEDALRNTKTELAKNHGRVGKLSKRLRSSERARKGLERDVQHLVLIQKFQGGGINEAGTRHGSQDISDKSPFAGLPDVPSYISQAPKALLTPRPSVSMFPGGATREGVVVLPEEEQKPGRMDTPARAAKRSRGEMEEPNTSIAHSLPKRIVVCTEYYVKRRRCDHGEPCQSCIDNEVTCRRARCKDYDAGTCKRRSCLRFHAEDEGLYKNLEYLLHMSRK